MVKAVMLLALAVHPAAWASGFAVEYGRGWGIDSRTFRIAVHRDFALMKKPLERFHAEPSIEVSAAHTGPEDEIVDGDSVWEVSLRAVIAMPLVGDGRYFIQVGTGPTAVSERVLEVGGDRLDFGTNILFRSHLGLGYRPPAFPQWALIYQVEHTSNAGLGEPNPGLDTHAITIGYDF